MDVVTAQNDRDFLLTRTGTGSIRIFGDRILVNPSKSLIEGDLISIDDQGKLKVVRSRWKITNGDTQPKIEDPVATETQLLFSTTGFVEIVHDIFLVFDWEDERYTSDIQPQGKRTLFSGVIQQFPLCVLVSS
ncbi:hypothetical protein HYY75_05150 [bacterium]|nr:hypothetical protein [bacterium]